MRAGRRSWTVLIAFGALACGPLPGNRPPTATSQATPSGNYCVIENADMDMTFTISMDPGYHIDCRQFVQEGRHNKYGLPLRRLADHVQPKLQLLCRYYFPAFHETLAVYDDGQMLRGSEQDAYNANGGVPAPPDQPLPTR